jgi:hypothetical protein
MWNLVMRTLGLPQDSFALALQQHGAETMLHLIEIDETETDAFELPDAFRLHRGYLFDWSEDVEEHGRALGGVLATVGLTAPVILGAIAGVAHMLENYWTFEDNRPAREAHKRMERFAELARDACFEAIDVFLAAKDQVRH